MNQMEQIDYVFETVSKKLPEEGVGFRLPCLPDLLAMKLFALKSGSPCRTERDTADIVHLTVENNLSVDKDLKPLCERFADRRIYKELTIRIREITDA